MPTRPALEPIVGADVLHALDDSGVVCEVGSTMGGGDPTEVFEAGHLPSARFVSLDTDLSVTPGPIIGRHPLPKPAEFAATLGRVGISVDTTVIAYDRQGGGLAARLVWMLRVLGHPAALLDGGFDAWDGPLEEGPGRTVQQVTVAERPWPSEAVADADEVDRTIAAGGVVIDSRDPARYAGDHEPIDATAGHVPGACNVPFPGNLDAGRFRSAEALRERFAAVVQSDTDDSPIVYCGSGVTACHNALAMERAGFELPRLYVGSWSGWSTDPGRPVATGTTP